MNSIDFYAKFIGEEARKLKSSTIFSEESEPNQQRQHIKKAEQKFKDLNIKDRLLYNPDPVVQDAARKGVREYEKGVNQRDDLRDFVKQAQQAQTSVDANRPTGVDKEEEQPKTSASYTPGNDEQEDAMKAKANSLVKRFKDEKWEDRLTNNEDPVIADQSRKIRDKFNNFREKRKNLLPKSGDISKAMRGH